MNKQLLLSVAGTAVVIVAAGLALHSQTQTNVILHQTQFLQVESGEEEVTQAFIQFMARYGRSYGSKGHAEVRFSNFKSTFRKVSEHNKQNGSGFKLGINRFADITEDEFLETYGKGLKERPLLGAMNTWDDGADYDEQGRYIDDHDSMDHNYFDYNDYHYIDEKLKVCSKDVNWVKEGKVGKPKQQSTCGSCWAHSTIASIETLYAIIHDVKHHENVTLFSEQQLVDCNFIPNLGCMGGRRQFSFDYATQFGLTTADKYPYMNKQQELCNYTKDTDMVFKIDSFKVWERPTNADIEKLVC